MACFRFGAQVFRTLPPCFRFVKCNLDSGSFEALARIWKIVKKL